MRKVNKIESIDIAIACARIAEDKKGQDIKVIEVGEIIPITDFFVLITCSNRRHVDALSQEIMKAMKEKMSGNPRVEGRGAGWWVLLDAGIVVVHLFEERARDFYDLDNLWADAREIDWKQ